MVAKMTIEITRGKLVELICSEFPHDFTNEMLRIGVCIEVGNQYNCGPAWNPKYISSLPDEELIKFFYDHVK